MVLPLLTILYLVTALRPERKQAVATTPDPVEPKTEDQVVTAAKVDAGVAALNTMAVAPPHANPDSTVEELVDEYSRL